MSLDRIAQSYKSMLMESIQHPMILVDGVPKHRHNSLGQPIHPTDEGIRNFHRWFGDSSVTDEHGRPRVLYHGTSYDEPIHEFDRKWKTKHGGGAANYTLGIKTSKSPDSIDSIGTWLTDSGEEAEKYGSSVYPVYSNMKNPLVYNSFSELRADWREIQNSGGRGKAAITRKKIILTESSFW